MRCVGAGGGECYASRLVCSRAMRVTATTEPPSATAADTFVVGVFDDEDVAHDTSDGALGALLERGEAKRTFKHLAVDRKSVV